MISESQQGFKSDRPTPEETVRAGVFAAADVSEHAPQTLQQERKGDDRLLLLLILMKLSEHLHRTEGRQFDGSRC